MESGVVTQNSPFLWPLSPEYPPYLHTTTRCYAYTLLPSQSLLSLLFLSAWANHSQKVPSVPPPPPPTWYFKKRIIHFLHSLQSITATSCVPCRPSITPPPQNPVDNYWCFRGEKIVKTKKLYIQERCTPKEFRLTYYYGGMRKRKRTLDRAHPRQTTRRPVYYERREHNIICRQQKNTSEKRTVSPYFQKNIC